MTVTLYLDVYAAVNLAADLAVLNLLNLFFKIQGKRSRIVCGALFGTGAACGFIFLLSLPQLWRLLYAVITGSIMLLIAFGRSSRLEFGRRFAGLWLITAAAEGIWEMVSVQEIQSCVSFLVGMAGIYGGGRGIGMFLMRQQSLQKDLYEVVLCDKGNRIAVTALLDSGNRLYEPYSHQPVHVISKEIAKKMCRSCNQVVFIPFHSIGTSAGLMPGFRIDEMEIRKDGRLIRCLKRPWIGVSRQPLSGRHQYEMLLHGEE